MGSSEAKRKRFSNRIPKQKRDLTDPTNTRTKLLNDGKRYSNDNNKKEHIMKTLALTLAATLIASTSAFAANSSYSDGNGTYLQHDSNLDMEAT
ncbi:hypothetical protein SU32_16400, partial [Ahrensia marina]